MRTHQNNFKKKSLTVHSGSGRGTKKKYLYSACLTVTNVKKMITFSVLTELKISFYQKDEFVFELLSWKRKLPPPGLVWKRRKLFDVFFIFVVVC
jgi:hypothetical protein